MAARCVVGKDGKLVVDEHDMPVIVPDSYKGPDVLLVPGTMSEGPFARRKPKPCGKPGCYCQKVKK